MTTDRVELVIAVLGLLLGDGLLVAVANQVRERRQRYYRVLEDLLVPLDRILRRNKRLVDDLQSNLHQRAAEQHEGVELHPEALQRTFEALPEDDPRRVFWRTDIEELQTNNAAAVRLIDERPRHGLLEAVACHRRLGEDPAGVVDAGDQNAQIARRR